MLSRTLIGLIFGVSLAGTLGAYAPVTHAQFDGSATVDAALQEKQATAAEQKAAAVTSVASTTGNDGKVVTNQNAKDSQDASYGWIMQKIMQLFAWMLGVAAITLQDSVYYTVVTMGEWIHGINAIGTAWRVLRDIGNIVLIFGFLAIGLSTILDLNLYGWNNKMLPKLLLAAVFINFSLFASQALIDVGNLFATQFYTQINGGEIPTPVNEQFLTAISNEGISNKIMSQVGLQDIYGEAARNPAALKSSNTWISGFMGIILFIITSFVMFSLALILIARFVALVLLMVVAPIGFAGLAVPKLEKIANQWWGTLVNEVITAPILLLLLYVALAVITDPLFFGGFDGQKTGPDWLGWIDNGNLAGFAATMLSFLVAMGLLIAVAIVAKKMASFGSDIAMKWAGAASFGVAGAAGRGSVGWISQRASEKWRSSKIGRTAVIGRLGAGILDKGAKASFDVRGSSAFKTAHVDAGKPAEGGFRKWEEEKIKGRETYAKSLKMTNAEKAQKKEEERRRDMMKRTVGEIEQQNEVEKRQLMARHQASLAPQDAAITAARARLAAAQAAHAANPTAETQNAINQATLALNTELSDRARVVGEQKKEMDALVAAQARLVKIQKDEENVHKEAAEAIDKQAKIQYAENIVWGPGSFFHRNKEASEKIIKEAKKSKGEKDLEVIRRVIENGGAPAAGAGGAAGGAEAGGGEHH